MNTKKRAKRMLALIAEIDSIQEEVNQLKAIYESNGLTNLAQRLAADSIRFIDSKTRQQYDALKAQIMMAFKARYFLCTVGMSTNLDALVSLLKNDGFKVNQLPPSKRYDPFYRDNYGQSGPTDGIMLEITW